MELDPTFCRADRLFASIFAGSDETTSSDFSRSSLASETLAAEELRREEFPSELLMLILLRVELSDAKFEALKKLFSGRQPLRRSGLPEDIANAALWLASDDSSFVTGQSIVVDGGLTLGRRWDEYNDSLNRVRSVLDG